MGTYLCYTCFSRRVSENDKGAIVHQHGESPKHGHCRECIKLEKEIREKIEKER